ncbi:MAG: hypothetical protein K2P32_01400 [Clostridia bacterium]|nr:hypothetical protein [Clostridia bacterium]
MAKNLKSFKFNKGIIGPRVNTFFKDNKMFLITFFGLYLLIFGISLFIVLNYDAQLSHTNYYDLLLQGEYSYFKVTLKYLFYNLLLCFCSMITYRKKFAFAIMYFVVTFLAYRLAVNIVGSWQCSLLVNVLNAALFYFAIYTAFVISIVLIVSYINTNYLYCNDRCPTTLKSILKFSLITFAATSVCIMVFTVILPLLLSKILF